MADDEIEGMDIGAIVADEIRRSRGYDSTELADKRTRALEYKRGEMKDTPARPNGSSQTSRDFADTVSWILPGVVRVFTASDQMVQYDKVREENDDWAREATEYTNWSFFRENEGYRVLLNATSDSLDLGNGLAMPYWEPERSETRWFRDKAAEEIAILLEDGWQPTGVAREGKPAQEEAADEMGNPMLIETPTYTVKLARVSRPAKICDATCKPENLFINSEATTIEGARFVAYLHDDKTRSDLMEMADDYGWDKQTIEDLPAYSRSYDEVSQAREQEAVNRTSTVKSGDQIDLYECYLRADKDGDGVAELLRCWFAGQVGSTGELLGEPEEWEDDCPYTDIPCYPQPHRFDAQSVFDRTQDIQRVKTVLLRQALDNTYWVNLPMREAEAGTVENPDILVNPKFGGIIWRKKGSLSPINPHNVPYTADKSFAALQYMDELIAKRTGVSRTTMALDPEALQNQTATAAQQQRDAGYSQIELIARNMAELGWAKYFAKRLKLAIKHELVRKVPSAKEESGFRQIQASRWDPSMAVTINVGLGTGSRDRDMAMLNTIMMGQIGMAERLSAAGMPDKAIEFIPRIRNTAVKIAESSGIKNPEEFYPEFTDEDVQAAIAKASQPAPPPEVQLEQMKGETQKQLKQVDAQVAVHEAQVKAQGEIVKNQAELDADLQTRAADRDNAIAIETIKQQGEAERQQRDIALEMWKVEQTNQMERERMAVTAAQAQADREAAAKAPNTPQ